MAKTKPQPRDFSAYFATLDDPRQEINQRHKLIDIVVLAVCAAICGADKWTDVESFAKAKEEFAPEEEETKEIPLASSLEFNSQGAREAIFRNKFGKDPFSSLNKTNREQLGELEQSNTLLKTLIGQKEKDFVLV